MNESNNNNNNIYGVFENKKTKKKLVYYPCPKNANSSAKLFFTKHLGIDNKFVFLSDNKPENQLSMSDFGDKFNLVGFLPAKQKFTLMPKEYLKCCITRDPIDRFISAYKNRILFHKDEDFNNHSIDQILTKLENNKFENKHFLPQTFFLGNNLNYYDFYADISNISKFEKNVNIFFDKKINFPKIQTGGYEFDFKLNNNEIKRIKTIYNSDYNFLESEN